MIVVGKEVPKIWAVDWRIDPLYHRDIDYGGCADRSAFSHQYRDHHSLSRKDLPKFLHWKGPKKPLKDVFWIVDGVIIISPRFADLLRSFGLGPTWPEEYTAPPVRGTELHELPLYDEDKQTRVGTYFMLQISLFKDCFVPEASDNVKFVGGGWIVRAFEKVAVKREAAEGEDLWLEFRARTELILCSDRLKTAMEKAKIKPTKFSPLRVVDVHVTKAV